MQNEPVSIMPFGQNQIRIFQQQDGQPVVLVTDIADALKMDRGNLSKKLKRHARLFENDKGVVNITTPGGPQAFTSLTRDGVIGLLWILDSARKRDPEVQERLLAFQKAAKTRMGDMIEERQRLSIPEPRPWYEEIREWLKFARILSEETGYPLLQAQAKILRERGYPEWADDLLSGGFLLNSPEEPGFTATDLGRIPGILFGKSGKEVNYFLYNKDYIFPDGGGWRLTLKGERFGKEYQYVPKGSKYPVTHVRWTRAFLKEIGILDPTDRTLPGPITSPPYDGVLTPPAKTAEKTEGNTC